jgi:hypothetical protein
MAKRKIVKSKRKVVHTKKRQPRSGVRTFITPKTLL